MKKKICKKQMLYDANYDKELLEERLNCKTLCQEYNNLAIKDIENREVLMKKILGKTKENIWIEPYFLM